MDFISAFKSSSLAMVEIFLMGTCGFIMVKKRIVSQEGLGMLSHLVIGVTLPALIFCRLLRDFDFRAFPNWWTLPLISLVLTLVGLGIGRLFLGADRSLAERREFLSLVTFQNSGYLPLALAVAILPPSEANKLFVYIFLFLLGFNLVMWSYGVHLLSGRKGRRFEWRGLFTPPLIAILATLFVFLLGWQDFIPKTILRPIGMIGDCTIPLGLIVVGGNLASASLRRGIKKRALANLALAKLILMPGLALLLLTFIEIPKLIGLLILIEAAMPSATSLTIIANRYGANSNFISQCIFFSHIIGLVTIPLFLAVFGWWTG